MSASLALGALLNAGLLSAGVFWQSAVWAEPLPASGTAVPLPAPASSPASSAAAPFSALTLCDLHDQAVGLDRPAQTLSGGGQVPAFRLSASLCLPEAGRAPHPLVILVSGSGATDRDGNSVGMPLRPGTMKWVAAELARAGVASLRFDKRFLPASGGSLIREEDLRLEHLAGDVVAWVRHMRADRRFSRIVLAGHSEGGLVALLATRDVGVDGLVLLATPGRPLGDVLREQLAGKLPADLKPEAERILAALERGQTAADVPPALLPLYRPSVQPYLISSLRLNPSDMLRRARVSVMLVQGDADLQVSVADFDRLKAARPDALALKVSGMNHVLKQASGDLAAQSESYRSPDWPLAPGWVPKMAGFVKGRSGD